jgi:hypothetical protein
LCAHPPVFSCVRHCYQLQPTPSRSGDREGAGKRGRPARRNALRDSYTGRARHSLQGGRCALRLLTTDAVNFVVFFFCQMWRWQVASGKSVEDIGLLRFVSVHITYELLYRICIALNVSYMGEHQVI